MIPRPHPSLPSPGRPSAARPPSGASALRPRVARFLPPAALALALAALLLPACRGRADGRPPPPRLPGGYQRCTADADCAVAPSLAGLDRLPEAGDTCRGTCYVGIRRDALEAWKPAVEALQATVPCDREFEPCPPETDFRALCTRGTCTVSYAPR